MEPLLASYVIDESYETEKKINKIIEVYPGEKNISFYGVNPKGELSSKAGNVLWINKDFYHDCDYEYCYLKSIHFNDEQIQFDFSDTEFDEEFTFMLAFDQSDDTSTAISQIKQFAEQNHIAIHVV